MKTTITALAIVLSLFVAGCSKGERDDSRYYPMNFTDLVANYGLDNIADDVSFMVQAESEAVATTETGQPGFFGDCAQVTTTISGNTWTRVIDFGNADCTLANANTVRGKIILTFSDDFTADVRAIKYRFENFYHNNRLVQGGSDLGKTSVNGHPMATLTLNWTITTPNGIVFRRVGQRLREFTSGYNTLDWSDNQFAITGSWITAFPNGIVHISTINSPLVVQGDCAHIVRGTMKFMRDNSSGSGLLDYGNGSCDNQATLYINGNPSAIGL
jgi:hypothetical protein